MSDESRLWRVLSTTHSALMAEVPEPDVKDGIGYWNTQPATLDGVLGMYRFPNPALLSDHALQADLGLGYCNLQIAHPSSCSHIACKSLPRIDSLGSRQFLLTLIPELCTVPSAIRPLGPLYPHRTRALDIGAGIGRVTADVLLYLVSDVVLLEPVDSFVQEALARGRASENFGAASHLRWTGIFDKSKSVTFFQGTLQNFDPSSPQSHATLLDRVGYRPNEDDGNSGFDVIWCQWCLGHLSDVDLVTFLKKGRQALREGETGTGRSVIVVKENVCADSQDGGPRTVFDEQDSSLTRYALCCSVHSRSRFDERVHFQDQIKPGKRYLTVQGWVSSAKRCNADYLMVYML
jgi:protein N-terminal methyltransferase